MRCGTPERVSHLILYGGFALGWNKRARTATQKEEDAAMLTLMRLGWGKENAAFRQLFTSQMIPSGTKEQADWFNELQRITASGDMAARIHEANGETDVTALLLRVSVPTLVLHARDDAQVPVEAGAAWRPASRAPSSWPCRGVTTSSSRPSQPLASSWSTPGPSWRPERQGTGPDVPQPMNRETAETKAWGCSYGSMCAALGTSSTVAPRISVAHRLA